MKRTLLLTLALIAAACGGSDAGTDGSTTPDTTAGPGSTVAPGNPGDPLLIVSYEGGFAPIEFIINQPPAFVLLRDGTLISQGPQPAIFPGPAMPAMQQQQLTADQMKDIATLIEATGLPNEIDFVDNDASNFVADASTTVARYFDEDGQEHKMSVYALGMAEEMPDNVANLGLLTERLSNFSAEGTGGDSYVGDELIVRILQGGGFAGNNDEREWTFDFAAPDGPVNMPDIPCLVVDGADAESLRATLADATAATSWKAGNESYLVLARDLLPGESGCESQ